MGFNSGFKGLNPFSAANRGISKFKASILEKGSCLSLFTTHNILLCDR